MKLTRVEPFAKAAPGFNHDAAYEVYNAIMECPDDESAAFMTRAIVSDVMMRDIARHEEFLAKAHNEQLQKRAEEVKQVLAKQYLTKTMRGEDVSDIAKASHYLKELSKADPYDFQRRSSNAQKQRRAANGRWVRESTNVSYSRKGKALHDSLFQRMYGVTPPAAHAMNDRQKRAWQEAYQQISDLIGPYQDMDNAFVHLHRRGKQEVHPVANLASAIRPDFMPTAASVSVVGPPEFADGRPHFAGFMGQQLGGPLDYAVGEVGWDKSGLNRKRLDRYATAREKPLPPHLANQPGARLFNRLDAGSGLIRDTVGPILPPKAQAALMAGQFVGQYGPEAQRVLGPTVRRTGYRYRGVERKPSQDLINAFNRFNAQNPNATAAQRINRLVEPVTDERGREHASPVIQYFRNRLPSADLNVLQVKSGHVPPSEGIILNKDGKVITQAVGYGDDWYMPFNLKNVGRMRGGSYIRTRTFGGPTTEDVYTALMSGAKSMTVVSHNGVFVMHFDENFKGGRRYNDKAARMVGRYAHLLDATKSGQVELDALDPSRRREIHDEALNNVRNPDDPKAVSNEEDRLIAAERVHPKLSEEQDAAIKEKVLDDYADTQNTETGVRISRNALKARVVNDYLKQYPEDVRGNPDFVQRAQTLRTSLDNDDNLIQALNLTPQLERLRRRTLAEQRRKLTPLSLNGQGYYYSMQALREQFPYYIRSVDWHEWQDPANRSDSGYIKPNHLRPDRALAGWFDTSVNGYGKQPTSTLGRMWDGGSAKPETKPAEGAAGAGTGTTPVSAAGTATAEAARPARNMAFLDQEATKDLAKHIAELAQGNFGPNAPEGLKNQVVSEVAPWLTDPNASGSDEDTRKIANIARMTPDEIDRRDNEEHNKFRQEVEDARRRIKQKKLFELNRRIDEAFERRGRMPEAKDYPDDVTATLNAPDDTEYKLGGIFEPGRHNALDLQNKYNTDQDIVAAKLPNLDASQKDFDTAANQKMAALRRMFRMFQEDEERNAGRYSEQDRRNAERQVTGVWKARHLRRRMKDLEREPIEGEIVGEDQPRDRIIGMTASEFVRRLAGEPPQIENTAGPSAAEELGVEEPKRRREEE